MVVTKNQPGLGPSVNWLLVFIFPVLAQKSEETRWLMWLWLRVISDPVACGRGKSWSDQDSSQTTLHRAPKPLGWSVGPYKDFMSTLMGALRRERCWEGLIITFPVFFFSWSLFHSLPVTFCFLFYFSGFLFSHILSVYSSLSHFLYKKRT